jgi:hypothetical protein
MPKYSIDTSAILDAWVRHYPLDLFPSFWNKFRLLVETKEGIAIELISHELKAKDDGCYDWFKVNNLINFFVDISPPVETRVTEILKNPNYQKLVDDRKGTYSADPFVIALAIEEHLIVVTGERASNNILKPNIPDVCNSIGIDCINILRLMRIEKWSF